MHYIKEIIEGDADRESVHRRFTKYSRGEFFGPEIKIKKKGKDLRINASSGYEDILGEIISRGEDADVKVSGVLITKDDPKGFLSDVGLESESKKKKGIYSTKISASMSTKDLGRIYEELDPTYALLSLKTEKETLKTKSKPPKPGSGGDVQFCSATLSEKRLKDILEEICFDFEEKDFNEASIRHTYRIDEIVIPEEYQKDYSKARLFAKRRGVMKRVTEVDGREKESEYKFSA